MNCRQANKRLLDVLYHEANAADQIDFEQHLAGCGQCRDAFASSKLVLMAWDHRAPAPQPRRNPSELLLAARITPADPVPFRWFFNIPAYLRISAGAAAAACAIILGALYVSQDVSPDSAASRAGAGISASEMVQEKAGFFAPLRGSEHVYRDAAKDTTEKKQPAESTEKPAANSH